MPDLTVPSAPIIAASATNYCLLTGNVWGEGNILLGGAGSDTLEGCGGNDILDGDDYLNVRLSVRNGIDDANGVDTVRDATGIEIGSTDLMENVAVTGSFGPGTTGMTLQQAVFAGKVNPGNIVAVREILSPTPVPADCGAVSPANCDTALFSGLAEEYTITTNADGSVTVTDLVVVGGGGGRRGGGGGARRTAADGVDTLWNMERISFCAVLDPNPLAKGACLTRAAPVPIVSGGPALAPVARVTGSRAFGAVNIGTVSAPQTITVNNNGNANLVVSGVSVTDPAFSVTTTCGTVVPGGDCTVTVVFAPTTIGAKSGTLVITHNAAPSSSNVSLSGTGQTPLAPAASVLPSGPLAFAPVLVNTTSGRQAITVNNTGNANLVVSRVSVTGTAAASFLATTTCATVAPGSSCTVGVSFKPTTIGVKTATVTIAHNSNNVGTTSAVSVTGTARTPPRIGMAAARNFGLQKVNVNKTVIVTVTNQGPGTLRITSVTPSRGAFTATRGNCPTALAVGRSCGLNVTFRPTVIRRAYSGKLTVISNATISPKTMTLNGIGGR